MSDARRRGRDGADGRWRFPKRRSALPSETWSDADRAPRVLIECEDSSMVWAMERSLTDAGYEVAACVGPSAETTCALAATGRCELQEGADVVVNALASDAVGHPLASETRSTYPSLPIVVTARADDPIDDAAADDVVVLRERWSGPELVAAVDELAPRPPLDDPTS